MKKIKIKKGYKQGRLTVLEVIPPNYWTNLRVKCTCGTIKVIQLQSLLAGKVKSCGCLLAELVAKRQRQIIENKYIEIS